MYDKDFLKWIHERLVHVHGENECVDYMHKLRVIIKNIPPEQYKPNKGSFNSLAELNEWEEVSNEPADKQIERKIVQISARPASSIKHGDTYMAGTYALCDDGEVYFYSSSAEEWNKLPPIPQD